MDDATLEDGIRREIQDPSSITPASEVMSPSAAEPSAPRSAPVTPSNKPASEVVAPAAAETFATLFRRNKPVPRTPSLGCKNCEVLFAEVKVVRQLLDVKVAANDELKKLHSSTRRETVSIVLFLWFWYYIVIILKGAISLGLGIHDIVASLSLLVKFEVWVS